MALLAALLLVTATAHAADPIEILRDCQDDDVLQGDYTAAELRKARSELPTDIDEYSPCRDILGRAIAAKTAKADNNDGGDPGAGGGGTGGSTNSGGGGSAPSPDEAARDAERDAILSGPSSPADAKAVGEAADFGDRAVLADANPKSPGEARLAASVGRNGLPGTMLAVLALVAAALLAAGLPLLRRHRAVPHPRS